MPDEFRDVVCAQTLNRIREQFMLTEIIFNVFQRSLSWPGLKHGTGIILVGMETIAEEVRISACEEGNEYIR